MTGPDPRPLRNGRPRRVALGDVSRSLAAPPPGESFAVTWWGREWLRCVERNAPDSARLARGRAYASEGHVCGAVAAPGRITASVRGRRPRPYRATVRIPELTDAAWDLFLDAVAAEPAHTAALLDRDLPARLVTDAAALGVRLPPGDGELALQCSCPDRADPCKHTAALCYATARLLDTDPWLLLLLRGRSEDELLEELARRGTAHAVPADRAGHAPPADLPTVRARTVPDAGAAPLPDPLPPPGAPGEGPVLPHSHRPDPGAVRTGRAPGPPGRPDPLDPEALAFLATDAAGRAHAVLAGSETSPLPHLTPWQDAVRLAATHPRLAGRGMVSRRFARLAAAAGGTAEELARAAAAWRQGGEAGLAVLDEPWDPPAGDFDRGRSALAAVGARMTIDRNRLTAGTCQLRYGRDGRWYPYRVEGESGFWPAGPCATEATAALRAVER